MTHPRLPLAGVIGSPIAHSRSPQLHQHWLHSLGIAGYYIPMHVEPDNLETGLRTLPKLGFVGVNATVPHKERALEIADHVSDRARLIGAANTLTFGPDGNIHADNTDAYGFEQNLRQTVPAWQPSRGPAAIFGAGGAARAVVVALLDSGVPEVRITNRTRSRAEALQQQFGERLTVVDWDRADDMIGDAVTVVNTTSLGMTGHAPWSVPLDALRPGTVVTDLVYAPLETQFLAAARAKGCTCVDGLGMLLHQAVPAFERWFGACPTVDDALRQAVLR
ncbi:shikimate dehydrogenase [Roseovarius tibetensis]|uniref:shikimate dehydrogenase n=1 Tax=Roseovarius tibetensis TaxID=2685897 RepID=UPI003D7F46CC